MKIVNSMGCFIFVLFFSVSALIAQDTTGTMQGSANKQDTTGTAKSQDTSGISKQQDTTSVAKEEEMQPDAARLYNAGNELLKSDKYQDAIAKYDSALSILKDYRIYYQKGVAFRKMDNSDSAKIAFQNSVKAKPDFEAGYNALGAVYFSQGDMKNAIENFDKVVQVSTDTTVQNTAKRTIAAVYYKAGIKDMQGKKYKDAIDNLQKSVQYNNLDAAYLSLAKAYSETKKWDESIKAAQDALTYQSNITKAGPYYYMGIAYKNKGDNAKAKEMFNEAKSDKSYKKAAEYELSLLK